MDFNIHLINVKINVSFTKKYAKTVGDEVLLKTNEDYSVVLIEDEKYGVSNNIISNFIFSALFFSGIWNLAK